MSEQLDPRTRQRVEALQTYTLALEQGDLEAASAVLQAAEYDAVLERMIVELHMASQETTLPIQAEDVLPLRVLLHASAPQELATEASPDGASPVVNSASSMDIQESIKQKGKEAMSTIGFMSWPGQKGRHQHGQNSMRFSAFLQTLAAIFIVGLIVGGFVLLLLQRRSTTAGPDSSTGPLYKNPLITVASSDGTVYALQPGSGKVLWQYATHQEVDTMVQQSGYVYIATSSNAGSRPDNLYTFRASDGKLLWSKEYPILTGYATMAVDDNAIAISGGEGNGSMDVVNATDGSLLWRYVPEGSSGWDYPIIAVHHSVIYIRYSDGIEAFQLRTGKVLWKSTAVPVVDTIFFVGTTMYVLDNEHPAIITMNPQNGKAEKRVTLPADEQPVLNGLNDGVLYVDKAPMGQKPQICAVRISDGTHLWCSSKYLDEGGIFGVPVFMNSSLYYSQTEDSMNGKIRVVALDTHHGTVVWQWLSTETRLYNSVNAVMTVGFNGIIYVTSSHGLFALQASDGRFLWHLLTNKNLESFALPSVPGQTLQAPN